MGCLVSKDEWFYDAETGRLPSIRRLVEEKNVRDVDLKDDDGDTAVIMASLFGQFEVVSYLAGKGASVNVKNKEGSTALMMASFNNHGKVVDLLIEGGADVNAKNIHEITAVIIASQKGYFGIVKKLVDNKADVNVPDKNGFTAVIIASRNGHTDVVKLLTNSEADVDAKTKNGWNALIYASWKGHVEVVKQLLANHADVNANFSKALQKASEFGQLEACRLLLSAGAKITDAVFNGVCQGEGSAQHQATEIRKLLGSFLDTHQFIGTPPAATIAEDVLAMLDGELFDVMPEEDVPSAAAAASNEPGVAELRRIDKPHFLQLFEKRAEIDPTLKEIDLFDAFDDFSSRVITASTAATDLKLHARLEDEGKLADVFIPKEEVATCSRGGAATPLKQMNAAGREEDTHQTRTGKDGQANTLQFVEGQSKRLVSLRQRSNQGVPELQEAHDKLLADAGDTSWNEPKALIGQCSSPHSPASGQPSPFSYTGR